MKAIRFLAASMFFITGVIHFYVAITDSSDPLFIAMLIGGIVYSAIGVLLIMKKRFAIWLGLLPIPALVLAPFMTDFNNLDWTIAMFPIELVAVICCLILIIKKSKG